MSTKYVIETANETGEFTGAAIRSGKDAAIAVAHQLNVSNNVATRVMTTAGTEVATFNLRPTTKRQRRSEVWARPFTRMDARVTPPKGWEAAYFRPRRDAVTLRRRTEDGAWEYAVARSNGQILKSGITSTLATSRYLANVTKTEDLNTTR